MFETAALIILAVTSIGSLATLAWYIYLENKERAKTINALIAKSSQEFVNHEMTDKVEGIKPAEPIAPDLEEITNLDDETFDESIVKQ